MNKKSNKKSAMTLLSILATMIVVMIAIIVATPVITQRMTKITSGRATDGAINLGSAKGYFMCYKDTDNNLHQLRAEVQSNGSTRITESKNISECTFDIPKAAESFTISLIGGGGGGAATNAVIFNEKIADDSIYFGSEYASLLPFKDYIKDIAYSVNPSSTTIQSGRRVFLNQERKILSDIEAKIVITGYDGASDIVSCGYPINKDSTGENIIHGYTDTHLTEANAKDFRLYYSSGTEATAGIKTAYTKIIKPNGTQDDAHNKIKYTTRRLATLCEYLKANGTYEGLVTPNSYTQSGTAYIVAKQPSTATSLTKISSGRIPLSLSHFGIMAFVANTGGQPGEVKIFKDMPFIAKTTDTKITIPKSNIGEGAPGGESGCNNINTTNNYACNGKGYIEGATDATQINLNNKMKTQLTITNDVETNTLVANGGAGGTTIIKKSFNTQQEFADGEAGKTPNVQIPKVFLDKLNSATEITAPTGESCTYGNPGYNAKHICQSGSCLCDGADALMIGGGGSSAALKYQITGGDSTKIPTHIFLTSSMLSKDSLPYYYRLKDGDNSIYQLNPSDSKGISAANITNGMAAHLYSRSGTGFNTYSAFAQVEGIENHSNNQKSRGKGGKGAPGAIIIEW